MFPRQALTSVLHLFVLFAFFMGGLFFVSFPYLPELKATFLEESSWIGFGLFVAGIILFIAFYALDRGRYLVIRMGVMADIHLIRQAVEDCFVRQFSKQIALSDVEMGRKSEIQIKVSLPSIKQEAKKELLIAAEKQLSTLLRERFGYVKPFYLIVKL